jgi:hypothetical protein
MLEKYKDFHLNILLEKAINESVIYYSPNLRKLLSKMDNEIAEELLDIEVTDVKPDVTLLDLDDEKDNYLSFSTMKNVMKKLQEDPLKDYKVKEIEAEPKQDDNWNDKKQRISLINAIYKHEDLSVLFKKSRNPIRVGKLINSIFPGKFNSKQVEEFVNELKAKREATAERFELVQGDDIAFWYKSSNYAEIKGQLGKSCMRNSPESTFELYVENPEVCRMLILLEDDELIGRALLWKLNSARSYNKQLPDDLYFLDRQYTIKDSDVIKFKAYAEEKGWAYKTNNNHISLENITYKGESFNADMTVKIKNIDYDKYPYMDTFRRYDPSYNKLFNDEEDSSEYEGSYILEDISGGYRSVDSGVWSEWHERMIPEDEAVWSDWADSYLHQDSATRVEEGSRVNHGWYPEGCDDIVYDEWGEFYIHVGDAIYSEAYGYYIEGGSAVEVIGDIDSSDGEPTDYDSNWYHEDDRGLVSLYRVEDMTWFKRLSEKWGAWEDQSYALGDLFMLNYNKELILSAFKIVVSPVKDENYSVEYLSNLHAEVLGVEVDNNTELIMDKFEYFELIEGLLPELFKLLSSKLETLNNDLEGKGQLRLKFDEEDDEKYLKLLRNKISNIKGSIDDIEDGVFIDFEEG